jgi:hypothetical protein
LLEYRKQFKSNRASATNMRGWLVLSLYLKKIYRLQQKVARHEGTTMQKDLLDAMPNSVSRETLGCRPKEVLGCSENTSKPRRYHFVVACLALFALMPLVWHSKSSNLITKKSCF